jgi:hypothetical protein
VSDANLCEIAFEVQIGVIHGSSSVVSMNSASQVMMGDWLVIDPQAIVAPCGANLLAISSVITGRVA